MNIRMLILAAGPSEPDMKDSEYPQALAEINGTSLLERIINNGINIDECQYVYAFLDNDVRRFHLNKIADLLTPSPIIANIPSGTQGSACTALLAVSSLKEDSELLIISANELVDVNFQEVVTSFRERKLDAGTVTFTSIHPRYSYVSLSEDDLVTEAAQQKPISRMATAGVFWFAKVSDFISAAKGLIRKDANVSGKFYIAPCFNELILQGKRIGIYQIDSKKYIPLKTARQIQSADERIEG